MKLTFLLLILSALICHAEEKGETITIAGKEYTQAKFRLTAPDSALIIHSDGAVRVDPATLPENIRTRIGYDSSKAAEYTKAKNLPQKPRPPANEIFKRRYLVESNLPEGLIAEVFVEYTVTKHIPTASSRVGGGGKSWESKEWESSGIWIFIPHTKETANITTGEKFTASVLIDGKTIRPYEDAELYKIHKILSITHDKKQP